MGGIRDDRNDSDEVQKPAARNDGDNFNVLVE
jgi:hypothetical protein